MKRGRRRAAGLALAPTFVRGCARGGLACPANRSILFAYEDRLFLVRLPLGRRARLGSFSPGGSRAWQLAPLLLSGNKFSRAWASIWDNEPSFLPSFLPSLPPSWRWPLFISGAARSFYGYSRSIIFVKEIVKVANNVGPPEFQKVFEYRN